MQNIENLEKASCLSFVSHKFGISEFLWVKNKLEENHNLEDCWSNSQRPPKIKQLQREYPTYVKDYEKYWSEIKQSNVKLIYPTHENYPEYFYQIHQPPVALTYMGVAVWKNRRLLSIVGSREPSHASCEWLSENLTQILRKHSLVTVSGAARGVDQQAHAISLRNNQPTIAILPAGLKKMYPVQFQNWVASILDKKGAILSEYPLHRKMRKHHFSQRNRLISGMANKVLLVDAGVKSGSLMTAHHALDQNRDLAILPCHGSDLRGRGGLKLIKDGAAVIFDQEGFDDWLYPRTLL